MRAWVVVAILVAGGCGGVSDDPVKAMNHFADQGCACATASCLDGVQRELDGWIRDHQKALVNTGDEVTAAARRLAICAQKIRDPR